MGSHSSKMDLVFKSILLFCIFGLSTSRSVTLDDDIPTCDNSFKIISSYPSGYVAILYLVSESEVDGWSAEITMDHEFKKLTVNESTDLKCSGMFAHLRTSTAIARYFLERLE